MKFDVRNRSRNNRTFVRSNEIAAERQTEELRNKVFAKYQGKVGTQFKNSLAARRAAQKELKEIPQWWDDEKPRLTLRPSSSAVASIRPYAGAVYVAFKSNPSKEYYYPVGMGTMPVAAKEAEKLVTARSIGKAMHQWFGPEHALKKKWSKSGNSFSYSGKIIPYKGKQK